MRNKQLVLIVSLILVTLNLNAIEFNTYDMEVEHVFSASFQWGNDNENDLSVDLYSMGLEPSGPSLYFDKGVLVIADRVRKVSRTIYLHKDYSFNNIYKGSTNIAEIVSINDYIIGYGSTGIFDLDKDNYEIKYNFDIDIDELSFLRHYKDLYYQDNTLFIFDKDFKLWGIKNPGLDNDENRKNIVKEEDIIKEINEGKYKGLTIDSKKRLFLNGELQTIQYKTQVNYWGEVNLGLAGSINKFNYDYKTLARFNMTTYLGTDNHKNKYWCESSSVIIISDKGYLVDMFEYDYEKSNTYPAVSPEGDVYFMKYGEDNVILYKIPRKW